MIEATYEPSGAPSVLSATYVRELSTLKPCWANGVGAQLEYPKKPTVCVTHTTVNTRVRRKCFPVNSSVIGSFASLTVCLNGAGSGS